MCVCVPVYLCTCVRACACMFVSGCLFVCLFELQQLAAVIFSVMASMHVLSVVSY